MSILEINHARIFDMLSIKEIEDSCFEEGIGYPIGRIKNIYHTCMDRFYKVSLDGQIVSYFWSEVRQHSDNYINILTGQQHNDKGNVLYIGNVSVLPSARGNSIGKICMIHMLRDLKYLDYAILAVQKNNQYAINIYNELGFKVVDEIKDYYRPVNKQPINALVMVKENEKRKSILP